MRTLNEGEKMHPAIPVVKGICTGMLTVALAVCPSAVQAQSSRDGAAIRALPDIAGFRPGMTFQEASARLKAHYPKATIEIGEVDVAEFGPRPVPVTLRLESAAPPGVEAAEIIQMELTVPPGKPLVWAVLRRLTFPAGKEMTRTDLLRELRRQYGPENYGITVPIVNLYWASDEEGRRVETGSNAYNNCAHPGPWDLQLDAGPTGSRSSRFPGASRLLARPPRDDRPCKPLVHVKALLQPSGRRSLELIESTTVAVIDAALAARAQAATAALRAKTPEAPKR